MAAIVTGTARCNRSGCTATRPRDPVLEVPRPDCGAGIGVRCRRPSGHAGPFVDLHAARDLLADACGAYGRWRLCRTFRDHCYVFFDPIGGERTAKIELVELRDLDPER